MKHSLLLLMLFACMYGCLPLGRVQVGFPKKQTVLSSGNYVNTGFSSIEDFKVQRLSGSRVHLSWHVVPGRQVIKLQVVRRVGRDGQLIPLHMPASPASQTVMQDYSVTDINPHSDSSYYSIMQVDASGTKYFTAFVGVSGHE